MYMLRVRVRTHPVLYSNFFLLCRCHRRSFNTAKHKTKEKKGKVERTFVHQDKFPLP